MKKGDVLVVVKNFKINKLDENEYPTNKFLTVEKGTEYYIERITKLDDDYFYELRGVNNKEKWIHLWDLAIETYFKLKGSGEIMVGDKYKCTKFCMSKGQEVLILNETENEVKYKIITKPNIAHFMPGRVEHIVGKKIFLEYYELMKG